MNGTRQELPRSVSDIVLFGIIFIGFVIAAAGLVTTTLAVAVLGAFLMLFGLCSFMLKGG